MIRVVVAAAGLVACYLLLLHGPPGLVYSFSHDTEYKQQKKKEAAVGGDSINRHHHRFMMKAGQLPPPLFKDSW